MAHLLGIDLGTSSVKALLATPAGEVLGSGGAEYGISRPRQDWAEQDPEHWWQATISAVIEALSQVQGKPISIAAIGVSGQMHGTVLLDQNHGVLAPAVIWPDRRSHRQVEEITDSIGGQRLIEITGSPLATGFQAATIRWLQCERPSLWRRTRVVLLPKDYLRWRLTGEFCTDPSDGSGTLLLDVRRRDWSAPLLDGLKIEPTLLPPVRPSTASAGRLCGRAAEALGLDEGITVCVGAADTAASALGAGITSSRSLLLTISTGGQIVLPLREVRTDNQGRVHTFCAALEAGPAQMGWYQMAAVISAGMAMTWLRDSLLCLPAKGAYERMTSWAETVPAGANGLVFLPYLEGERTPHMDPQACGLLLGLTASHGQADLVRAVMEGVAFGLRQAYAVLEELGAKPSRIVLAGGGARSRLWRQIIADVFDLPVQRLLVADQSALGAVILAGASAGLVDPASAARAHAAYGPALEPNQERHDVYRALGPVFSGAYGKHKDDFRQLRKLKE